MPLIRAKGLFNGSGTFLFLSEKFSDVTIIVESGISEIRFPAHSLILFAMSRVLYTMLQADLREKSTRQITIKDSNPVAIKQFLRFLYVGEVDLADWREVLDLLFLAHKYEIKPLIFLCEDELVGYVTLANVCTLHEMAEIYSLKRLLTECQKLIVDGAFVVLQLESFESMSCKSVEQILSHRCLNVESECFVFDSAHTWGIAECRRKCEELTEENVLKIIQPLFHGIGLGRVPDNRKSSLPSAVIEQHQRNDIGRVNYHVPASMQKHMTSLKFVVELGAFAARLASSEPLSFLKFSMDVSAYLVGFRVVGMFRTNFNFGATNPQLTLGREDGKSTFVNFNLNSIPWKCGSVVGDYMWKEMVAYLPHPKRIQDNTTYTLTLKYSNLLATKWPKTRAESTMIRTVLGNINFYSFGTCTGITELLILPAPPKRAPLDELYGFC